ncbi:EscR/YscR/HrcR family type III secretion system export apparatus protein [Pantoea sp. SORGH_AS_0659]|uniref:EscR/YscR/HrcR family type III secretion system export apparatus protein n=1 Tax=Pantoea sp. SORGH_AS_0659 TaxID=3062597 RepID=UPI00285C04C6|nr:EscR/YscR/HrcR family type III secretion system export apparatus protein [Pantoea sp. SORGH_AS_0659]MDR6352525.1 type III secretion apparatus YscR/HrcR family protein [Pantoea sp. SORGH_AS_0659]
MENDISLISVLALASLAPFLIASGTCYIKFSIVFVMIRNAIGLQQTPSNLTLNSIAFIVSVFVMMPVVKQGYNYMQSHEGNFTTAESIETYINDGFSGYRDYLNKYADKSLVSYFEKAQGREPDEDHDAEDEARTPSLFSLLPAYALTEIKEAFRIGFYIYLPFVVIDLLVSSILLTLGMMMMSPVTISVPIKLLLFVVLDGWTLVSKGLIEQYLSIPL